MTAEDFAAVVSCSRTSVYKALAGYGVSDRVAIAIVLGLEQHPRRTPLLQ